MLRRILREWTVDFTLLVAFAALTGALAAGWFLGIDVAIRDWCTAHRPPVAYWTARVLNFLGNGSPIAVITAGLAGVLALWLGARRGRGLRAFARPMLPVVAAFVLTTGVILPLKAWTSRAAPGSPRPDAVEIFNDLPPGEYAASYPAGHVVVAIVWYGIIALLLDAILRSSGRGGLPRRVRLVLRLAPPVIVLTTTTYLGFHWLTDGIAAVFLGLLLDRLLARLPAPAPGAA